MVPAESVPLKRERGTPMKRLLMLFVLALVFFAVLPVHADQTYSYWGWKSKTDDDIYCFLVFSQIWAYYDYQQIGGKTIYCDGTESSWGATWCELDVRLEDATPCYYGSLATPAGSDPSRFFFGAPPGKRRGVAALTAATLTKEKPQCANS